MFLLNNGLINNINDTLIHIHALKPGSFFFNLLFYLNKFFTYWASFRIDSMAIGALGAYLIIEEKNFLLDILFSKSFQIFIYLVALIIIFFKDIVNYQFYSLIFMLIILNMSCNSKTIFSLDNKIMNYLGSISYGIYLFNYFSLSPVVKFYCNYLRLSVNIYTEILMCLTGLCITILISSISYHLFEGYFLNLKKKFSN